MPRASLWGRDAFGMGKVHGTPWEDAFGMAKAYIDDKLHKKFSPEQIVGTAKGHF